MRKQEFLDAYKKRIVEAYPWASDKAKLENFMAAVEKTITTKANIWIARGSVMQEAWKDCNGNGVCSLEKLRKLD